MGETKIIEIRGQGVGALSIDRAYPNILRGKMSNARWLGFCDKIDGALKPASIWMSRIKYLLIPLFLGVLGVGFGFWFISGSSGITGSISATDTDENNRNLAGRILIPVGSVLVLLCIISMAMMQQWAHHILQRDVGLVCTTESNELSDVSVSFLLRSSLKFVGFEHHDDSNSIGHHRHIGHDDRYGDSFRLDNGIGDDNDDDHYHRHNHHHHHHHHHRRRRRRNDTPVYVPKFQIECLVEGLIIPVTDTTTVMPTITPNSASLNPTMTMYTTEMTPVDRLKDLEAAKSLLSKEEYESKRQAILREL